MASEDKYLQPTITTVESIKTQSCHTLDSRQFFKNTPWEFDDGEKAGTPPFQAPEVIEQKAYGRAADWWSAGIVLFKMHTGTLPYRSDDLQDLENLILTRPVTFPKLSKGVKLNKQVYSLLFQDSRSQEDMLPILWEPKRNLGRFPKFRKFLCAGNSLPFLQESFWRDTNLLTATIYELLEKDPSQRLGSNDYNAILANPFVAEVSWDAPYSSHAMIANVFEQKMTRNKHGEYSINGNRDLKKQQLLGLSALRGCSLEITHFLEVLSFFSCPESNVLFVPDREGQY